VKITHFEIMKVPPGWVWLKVHTDEGIVGLGEPYLENHPEAVIAEVQRLEQMLVGQDPTAIERLWQKMYDSSAGYKGGPVKMSAVSGVDMALWDIAGKAAGLPVYKLLGGACRERIKMYRTCASRLPYCVLPGEPYRAGKPPREIADEVETYREGARILTQKWGFRALKLHFRPGSGLEVTSRVNCFAELFAAAREGAGANVDVAVDLHNPHPIIAAQIIEALAPYRPLFVEEPMPIERIDALAEVTRRCNVPIAAGERWMGKWVFDDALHKTSLAVVQPDLAHAGGITECKKIAALAEACFAKVALHAPLSPLALAASIQVDACIPNFLVQEHNEVNDWREDGRTVIGKGYLRNPFVLDAEGCVAVPDQPGLGIELDEDGLETIMAKPWSTLRG
jgi:galactonate dehydratase